MVTDNLKTNKQRGRKKDKERQQQIICWKRWRVHPNIQIPKTFIGEIGVDNLDVETMEQI